MKYYTIFNSINNYNEYISNIENQNISYITSDDSVHYKKPHDYSQDYLTFVSKADNNKIGWKADGSYYLPTISVSTDDGQTWTNKESSRNGTILATLNNGDKLLIKGNNNRYGSNNNNYNYFTSTKNFDVEGNIMSLLYGDNFMGETSLSGKDEAFAKLFYGNTYLVNAQNLILPATTLADYCYMYMFSGCESLTTAPDLPATTLVDYCYEGMFRGCTGLNYIKCLANDISSTECIAIWVYNVAATGTFVKNPNMSSWTTGTSGIPSGWTVQDAA